LILLLESVVVVAIRWSSLVRIVILLDLVVAMVLVARAMARVSVRVAVMVL
jgi:hypothetical protein